MKKSFTPEAEKKTFEIFLTLLIMLTISFVFAFSRNPNGFINDRLGLNNQAFNNIYIWLFALAIAVFYTIYTIIAVPFVKENLLVFSKLKIISIGVTFLAGIFEELLFRQTLMDWLMNLNYGVVLQVVASTVLFGLAHGLWVFLGGELKIALPVILSTAMLGGLLAILYIVADRNLLAPIVAHIAINIFIEPWLILSSVSRNLVDTKNK